MPSLESLLEEPIKRVYEYRTYLTRLMKYGELMEEDISGLKVILLKHYLRISCLHEASHVEES